MKEESTTTLEHENFDYNQQAPQLNLSGKFQ